MWNHNNQANNQLKILEFEKRNWTMRDTLVTTEQSPSRTPTYTSLASTASRASSSIFPSRQPRAAPPPENTEDDAVGVHPRQGIFVDDRTQSGPMRFGRYVPDPDLTSLTSFATPSIPLKEVTTRWERRSNRVPVLVIEAKIVAPKPIKPKL
ncbi:hypothetical protein PG990_003259 [Apiospora arundinis]